MGLLEKLGLRRRRQGVDGDQQAYETRNAEVRGQYQRFADRLSPASKIIIDAQLDLADGTAVGGEYAQALIQLNVAAETLEFELAALRANARGTPRILTGDQLVEKFKGRQPKPDVKIGGKVVRRRSTAYKATQAALHAYQQSVKDLADAPLGGERTAEAIQELKDRLDAVVAAANRYIASHRNDTGKRDEVQAMRELVADATREKNLLDEVMNDQQYKNHPGQLTIRTAMEFKRFNIDLDRHAELDELREDHVDLPNSRVNFGAGKVNTVAKLVYNTSTGPETRIFKPEKEREDDLKPAARNIGIDKDNPNYGRRNIASRKVCEQLGLGDLIPKTEFVTFNGQVGLSMGFAPGKSLIGSRWVALMPDEEEKVRQYLDETNPIYKAGWLNALKDERISQREDGLWCKSEHKAHEIPYENSDPPEVSANIQKGLMNLQWLDAFVGQVDRQPENYMVNVDPDTNAVTVTGIDNDFSFGANLTGVEMLTVNDQPTNVDPNTCGDNPNQKFNYCGFPPLIDRALYDRLVTQNLSWENFSQDLPSLISDAELDAARGRFNELKEHAQRLGEQGLVVDDWVTFQKDGKNPAQLMKDDPRKNFFKRDVESLNAFRNRGVTKAL
jgi:hypothetical protein